MAFRVICSTHTGRLIGHLAGSLRAEPGRPGEPVPVLLPSVPLREKVRVELARGLGVAMGVEFLLPGAFFNRVAVKMGAEPLSGSWEPDGLFWRLLPSVLEMAERPDSPLATLGSVGDPAAVVGFARHLADRFDQYQHYRPDMIRAWDAGRPWSALPEVGKDAEAWQLELWGRIRTAPDGARNLVRRFDALKEALRAAAPPFERPLEVLSTGPFPRSTLELLALLGQRGEVNLRLLVPSREHISYLASAKAQRAQGRPVDPDLEGHPLLASLGVQARDHFRILEELLLNEEHFEWLDPEEEPADSLLRRLQEDIRSARQPQAHPGRVPDLSRDRSLRVHRCHGAQREIEVLRDELVRAFEELDGLKAEDVLVLSPDLDAHGPLAAALFPAPGYGLPLGLSETRESLGDPLLAVIHSLLLFSGGRAPLSEGLALLGNAACAAVLGEETAQDLGARLERSGVTFGLDAGHRERLGAGGGRAGTWRSGLERLAEGLWFGGAEAPDRPVDGAPCLPLADDLSSGRGAGLESLRWLGRLLDTAEAWGEPGDPGAWAGRLGRAADELFSASDLGREALARVQAELLRAAAEYGCAGLALPARVVAEKLRDTARGDERRVRRVGGRIGFGGLKPLRALPCRVLALVGLDDPSFPRRGGLPAWDLLGLKPEPGDRDPRQEDRQLFLDALLSAGERVIITGPVRHLVSNKDLPFSVCVEELLRAAAATAAFDPAGQEAAVTTLVLDHPLQPYARDNFRRHGSYDRAAREIGRAVEKGGVSEPFGDPEPTLPGKPGDGAVDLEDLLRAFKSPAKAWLEALGIRPADGAQRARLDDDPLETGSGLAGWTALDRELRRALKGGAADARALAGLRADRLLSYGPLGDAQERCRLAPVRAVVGSLIAEGGPGRERVHASVGGGIWADLDVDARGANLVLAEAGDLDDPKRLLRAWGRACVDAVGGRSRPLRRFGMLGDGKERRPRADVLPTPDPGQAKQALVRLLEWTGRAGRELLPLDFDWSCERAGRLLKGAAAPLTASDWETHYAQRRAESAEFALAWRDRNPWQGDLGADWDRTALELWKPILEWRERAQAAGHA